MMLLVLHSFDLFRGVFCEAGEQLRMLIAHSSILYIVTRIARIAHILHLPSSFTRDTILDLLRRFLHAFIVFK